MTTKNLWNESVPRAELDQRARDARLRLDQIERLVVPRFGRDVRLVPSAVCHPVKVVKIA